MAVIARAVESLPETVRGPKISISLTFENWRDGCDIIQRMDAFLAIRASVRKVEVITRHPFHQKIAGAEFPLLLAANKLGLGRGKETWDIMRT